MKRAGWFAVLALGVALLQAHTARAEIDPAARLPKSSSGSEHWDLTAQFEGGQRLFARFLISNVGPGVHNAVAVGHWITAEGGVHKFKNGRRRSRWKLSPDRLFLDIGSSHLDLHGERVTLDVSKDHIKIHLQTDPWHSPTIPTGLLPPGYHMDVIDSAAAVEGSVWLPGMKAAQAIRGRMAISHAWTERAESDVLLRQLEFFSLQGENSMHLIEITTPKGSRSRWLRMTEGHDFELSTTVFELETRERLQGLRRSGYVVPKTLQFSGPGLVGEISLKDVILEHDPLEELPQPFRFLVSLKMRPHRVWANGVFEVTLPPNRAVPSRHYQGQGIAIATFMGQGP